MLSVKPSALVIALLIATSSQLVFCAENRKKQKNDTSAPQTATAKVEKVFSVRDGDLLSTHYQITWQGQSTIVDDPINSTDIKEGEDVSFVILRIDMRSSKEPNAPAIISFQTTPFPENGRR